MTNIKYLIIAILATVLVSVATIANVEDINHLPNKQYVKVMHDSDIFSLIADRVIPVGKIKKGTKLELITLADGNGYFQFGHGNGFIAANNITSTTSPLLAEEDMMETGQPAINQHLITTHPASVHIKTDSESTEITMLAGNLRYPIQAKITDQDNEIWYQINLAGQEGFIKATHCELDSGIPVLTFHHFLRDAENKKYLHTSTTTSDTAFGRQMAYLKELGYQTISMSQLEKYLNNGINLPGKVIVLTFDDGLKSVYRYAYPVLKQLNFNATAFVISSRIKHDPQQWDPNSLQFMSISELNEIQDVFDIQSHTHFLHRYAAINQPILLVRSYHNILLDFKHSRRALVSFNPDSQYLSYPFGGYNQKATEAAKDAGFHLAVTTQQGKVNPGDNPFTLKRLYILRNDSLEIMAERLGNGVSSIPLN